MSKSLQQAVSSYLRPLVIIVLVISLLLALRPLPAIEATTEPIESFNLLNPAIRWPGYGQAAAGASGFGVLATGGEQTPVPVASITKLITAMTVLSKKPLQPGEQGPSFVLAEADVALYEQYLARGGSVVPVSAGQQFSQRKALEAVLIPSGNNMADSLAVWAFGSMDNYIKEANAYLKSLGLKKTKVAGASGFSPESVSTASELVQLGIVAMDNPVIAEIVGSSYTELPNTGGIRNTNWLLGSEGIVGLKTGNTDEAGGCYLYAAKHRLQGREVLIVGATLGANSLYRAMVDSRKVLADVKSGFSLTKILRKNQVVASYQIPWQGKVEAIVIGDADMMTWGGKPMKTLFQLRQLESPLPENSNIGKILVSSGSHEVETDIVLKDRLKPASPLWRIFR